jgi:hypothetical protein
MKKRTYVALPLPSPEDNSVHILHEGHELPNIPIVT